MKKPLVTMPRWPAFLMATIAAACAVPAVTISAPTPEDAAPSDGRAHIWKLSMANGGIDLLAQDGRRITVVQPEPLMTFDGRRYDTEALTVDIADRPCIDDQGRTFPQNVMVVTDNVTLRGCIDATRSKA